MSDIWKGTISAILGALVAGCVNYFITIKNIEFNQHDSEYKQLFPLKFKAYNDLKKAMYDLELISLGAKKIDRKTIINDYDAYFNNFSSSLVEIETLVSNSKDFRKKAKLINSSYQNDLFLSSHQWLYLYNTLFQLTYREDLNEQKQQFILKEVMPIIKIVTLQYQTYLYEIIFEEKSFNAGEIKNMLKQLDNISVKIDQYIN